jgi:hypothetical protein
VKLVELTSSVVGKPSWLFSENPVAESSIPSPPEGPEELELPFMFRLPFTFSLLLLIKESFDMDFDFDDKPGVR